MTWLADLQQTVYHISGLLSAKGRACDCDRESSLVETDVLATLSRHLQVVSYDKVFRHGAVEVDSML